MGGLQKVKFTNIPKSRAGDPAAVLYYDFDEQKYILWEGPGSDSWTFYTAVGALIATSTFLTDASSNNILVIPDPPIYITGGLIANINTWCVITNNDDAYFV